MPYPLTQRAFTPARLCVIALLAGAGIAPVGSVAAAPPDPACTPVLAGEFADMPRSSAAPQLVVLRD